MLDQKISEMHRLINDMRLQKEAIFALGHFEGPASSIEILDAEKQIGINFPRSYRTFMAEFGAGSFGLIDILSVKNDSEFSILEYIESKNFNIKGGFLPISDDYCGGVYCIIIDDSDSQEIYYKDEDGILSKSEFVDIFDFVSKCAF